MKLDFQLQKDIFLGRLINFIEKNSKISSFKNFQTPFDLYDPALIVLPKEHNCFRDDEKPFVEQNL